MRSPCGEEGAAEMMCNNLTADPVPVPLCLWEGGGREFRIKVESRKKGEVGERCFMRFSFIYYYPSLIL